MRTRSKNPLSDSFSRRAPVISSAQRSDHLRDGEIVAVDLAIDATLGIDHRDLQHVIEAARRRRVSEAEIARQRVQARSLGTQEVPAAQIGRLLTRERTHRLRRVERQIEADAD